jgi:hypothetical protein
MKAKPVFAFACIMSGRPLSPLSCVGILLRQRLSLGIHLSIRQAMKIAARCDESICDGMDDDAR